MDILIEQEIALHQYEVRQSNPDIARLIHCDFREVGESGLSYDYQSIIAMMGNELPSNRFIHSQDYECIQLEASVQLLLYKSASVDDLGNSSHFAKRSSIWVLNGTQWQLKYHQGTACDWFELINC